MGFNPITYAASNAYAEGYISDSLDGVGALAGAPCKIKDIQTVDNNNVVTFEWTDDNGESHISVMTVYNGLDGQDGNDGKSIVSMDISTDNKLTATLSDNTVINIGTIQTISGAKGPKGNDGLTPHIDVDTKRWFIGDYDTGFVAVPNTNISYNDLTDLPNIPLAVSDLANDKGFIDNTISNLINYYSKTETYSQDEILSLIKNINKLTTAIVDVLPTENISTSTIYLTPSGNAVYEQHMYISGAWADLGSTSMDLDGYVTLLDFQSALEGKSNSNHTHTEFHQHQNKAILDTITSDRLAKWDSKFSGNYNDLIGQPNIPIVTNDLTDDLKAKYDNAVEMSHNHGNQRVLNKFGEVEGKLQYNGKDISSSIGGGANVEASSKNGYIKINNVNTRVYDDSILAKQASHINRNLLDKFSLSKNGDLLFDNKFLGFHTTTYSRAQDVNSSESVLVFDLSSELVDTASILSSEMLVRNTSKDIEANIQIYDINTELINITLVPGEIQQYRLGSSKNITVFASGLAYLKIDATIIE